MDEKIYVEKITNATLEALPIKKTQKENIKNGKINNLNISSLLKTISCHGFNGFYPRDIFDTPDKTIKTFKTIFSNLWNAIPEIHPLKNNAATITITKSNWEYYGKPDNRYILREYNGNAYYCYRFINIDIIQSGTKYTLLTLPITQLTNQTEILKELIEFTKQRIQIKVLLLDRDFLNYKTFNYLHSHKINYVTPVRENVKIKRMLKRIPDGTIITDFPIYRDFKTNLILKRKNGNEKYIIPLATNLPINSDKYSEEFKRLYDEYKKRWNIKLGWRLKKSFLPITTTKDYRKRLFYFLNATLLYNLWNLIDDSEFFPLKKLELFLGE